MDLHRPPAHISGPNDGFMIQMSKCESQVYQWAQLDYDPLFTTLSLGGCRRATDMLSICVASTEITVFCFLLENLAFFALPLRGENTFT